jgi:hypothetical protein
MSQTMPRNVPPSVPSMSNTPDFMQRQQQPDPRFRPMASSSNNTGGSFVSLNEAAVFHHSSDKHLLYITIINECILLNRCNNNNNIIKWVIQIGKKKD